MPDYATQQDLIDRYGEAELIQLTDRTGAGTIDATIIDQALTDATEEMDGYIGARYTLPLPTTPTVLVRICADIARYRLYDIQAPEQVAQRYKDAVTFLISISKGMVTLGLPTEAQPTSAGKPQTATPKRIFDRTSLADYSGYNYGSDNH